MSGNRKMVIVEHNFDWRRINGCTLLDAAAYLTELSKTLPPDAAIDEHWTGYEDMEIRLISRREESDEELSRRMAVEAAQERLRKEWEAAEKEKAKRRKEYDRLKREFGQ